MRPYLYFKKELQAIDPAYFAAFNHRHGRWQIRKLNTRFPMKRHYESPYCYFVSDLIFIVCKEDKQGNDIGYQELDRRVIFTIQESNRFKDNIKKNIELIDAKNERLEQGFKKETEEMSKDLAKQIWHHYQTNSIYLGG